MSSHATEMNLMQGDDGHHGPDNAVATPELQTGSVADANREDYESKSGEHGAPLENLDDEVEKEDLYRVGTVNETNGFLRTVQRVQRGFAIIIPYGGLLSSCFNLASCTLGAGIISLPSAFNLSGVIMSCIYLVLVNIATIYSLYLISRISLKTKLITFSSAARHLLGPGADYFLGTLIVILCFGGSVAYIIAMSTLLTPVLKAPGAPAYLGTKSGIRLMTSMVWLVLMLPLVIPKQINSLRYVSGVGVLFIVYFVICIIVHSATNGLHDPQIREEMVLMRTGNDALAGLGIFCFSFMSQLNAFEIFNEMTHRTTFHFTLYSSIAMTTCAVLYFLAGFFGYADFGSRVTDSVLTLYDPVKSPYIMVGYVGIVVKICAAFALHMIPFRDALYDMFGWNPVLVPYWKHALVMAVPTTLALICGLFIPKINSVLGLLGSFCGGIIGMVMPALFFMYAGNFTLREVGWVHYIATYLLLFGGVVAVVFGTVTTIYSTAMGNF